MSELRTNTVPLGGLIQSNAFSNTSVRKALGAFCCERDRDVEAFLRRFAYTNERNGSTRTYLALNAKKQQEQGELDVVAYCALALTITDFSSVAWEDRYRILGNIPGLKQRDMFPGYLLAQLGRDSRYSHAQFDCASLLSFAERRIGQAVGAVGGRAVYLDCKRDDSLLALYERNGYEVLLSSKGTHPVKMVKPLLAA